MPLKDYFKGGRSKHPKFAASQSLGGQYKNTVDRVGTTRFQEEDSPWDNMSMLPSVPIAGARYKEWVFYDNTDTSLTDVWTESKSGAGTTLGLLDHAGGGATFTIDNAFGDYNWYESKQEVAQILPGSDLWIEAKIRIPQTEGAYSPFVLSLNERIADVNGVIPLGDHDVDALMFIYYPRPSSDEGQTFNLQINDHDDATSFHYPETRTLLHALTDDGWHTLSVHISQVQPSDVTGTNLNATHVVNMYFDDERLGQEWISPTSSSSVPSMGVSSYQAPSTEMTVSFALANFTGDETGRVQIEYIKLLQDDD